MSTVNDLVADVRNEFLSRNSNLLALTRNGTNDVMQRISASMALDKNSQDEVMFYADAEYLDQKDLVARRDARATFKQQMYAATCRAFIKVQHNLKIEFAAKLTPEALQELYKIECIAGVREPLPPPPPQKSAEELLTEEVVSDWRGGLATDKLRAKINRDPNYKRVFDSLMNSGKLDSICTSLHDAGQERQ